MKLNTWAGADGQQRAGLELSAWRVDVIGAIGRRGKAPTPVLAGAAVGGPPSRPVPEDDTPPF